MDPLEDENWRVLLVSIVSEHVVNELARVVMKLQETETVQESEVMERRLSEVTRIRTRESASVETSKTIYERTPYPSKSGGLEKAFIEYADTDNSIEAFAKILINDHSFVRFRYLKEDGLMAQYYPDFLVRGTNGKIYIVETKAQEQVSHPNVQKKRTAVLEWTERINALPPEQRSNCEWHYAIISDDFFYEWRDKGASVTEMLDFAKLRPKTVINQQDNLFSE